MEKTYFSSSAPKIIDSARFMEVQKEYSKEDGNFGDYDKLKILSEEIVDSLGLCMHIPDKFHWGTTIAFHNDVAKAMSKTYPLELIVNSFAGYFSINFLGKTNEINIIGSGFFSGIDHTIKADVSLKDSLYFPETAKHDSQGLFNSEYHCKEFIKHEAKRERAYTKVRKYLVALLEENRFSHYEQNELSFLVDVEGYILRGGIKAASEKFDIPKRQVERIYELLIKKEYIED